MLHTIARSRAVSRGGNQMIRIDLLDSQLFGNDAAENEAADLLQYYFVGQKTFENFENSKLPLSICRARKGMGKSALISYVSSTKEAEDTAVVARILGSDIVPNRSVSASPAEILQDWILSIESKIDALIQANSVRAPSSPDH